MATSCSTYYDWILQIFKRIINDYQNVVMRAHCTVPKRHDTSMILAPTLEIRRRCADPPMGVDGTAMGAPGHHCPLQCHSVWGPYHSVSTTTSYRARYALHRHVQDITMGVKLISLDVHGFKIESHGVL